MCGIATYNLTDTEAKASQPLARAFLCSLVDRGRDASGMAWRNDEGRIRIAKGAVPGERASAYVGNDKMASPVGLIHTRWATQGSPKNNRNNHPIQARGIVGVHNGHCANDDALLARLPNYGRLGEVDSEAIFATIRHGEGSLVDRLGRIRGGAALAWMLKDDDPRRVHVARLARSPLWYATTTGGSFVAASTRHHVLDALKRADLHVRDLIEVPEGIYFPVDRGEVGEWVQVAPFYRQATDWPSWVTDDEEEEWMQMALAFAESRQVARGRRRVG